MRRQWVDAGRRACRKAAPDVRAGRGDAYPLRLPDGAGLLVRGSSTPQAIHGPPDLRQRELADPWAAHFLTALGFAAHTATADPWWTVSDDANEPTMPTNRGVPAVRL